MGLFDFLRRKETIRVRMRFTDEISAISAADQLRQQHFRVTLAPGADRNGMWIGSAEISIKAGKEPTKERIRRFLATFMHAYCADYIEENAEREPKIP